MNSRSSFYSMTTMAVLILLVATVSTMASASTLRNLHPKPKSGEALGLARGPAERCQDNPDWRLRDDPEKSCDWIGEKEGRKFKKCKKKNVKKNCKETCGKCGKKKCPTHVDSDKFEESCKDYKDGLECMYDYSVIGCLADGSDFVCSSGTSWTCGDDYNWKKDPLFQIKCISDHEDWGKKCDPETYKAPEPEDGVGSETPVVCPDFVPTAGTNCERTGPTPDGCPYNYGVDGCTADTLVCRAVTTFYCEEDGDRMTWQQEIHGSEFCDDTPDNWPSGACDPNEPVLPPDNGGAPEADYCPLAPPQHGLPCTRLGDEAVNPDGCEYNHIVTGCTFEDIGCSAISKAYCEGPDPIMFCKGDDCRWTEETKWAVVIAGVEFCDSQPKGSPHGNACNPLTFDKEDYSEIYPTPSTPIDKPYACPEVEPSYTDHCMVDDIIPPGGCPYTYIVSGCTPETLSCGAIVFTQCEAANEEFCDKSGDCYDGIWSILSQGFEECSDAPKGWPAGEYCDPDRFEASDYL